MEIGHIFRRRDAQEAEVRDNALGASPRHSSRTLEGTEARTLGHSRCFVPGRMAGEMPEMQELGVLRPL